MHVTLFVGNLAGGGAERVFVSLANEMAGRGVEVDMLLAQASGPFLSQLSPSVNVVNLGVPRAIFSLPAVARYLRKSQPSALICCLPVTSMIGIIAQKLSRIQCRVIATEHGFASRPQNSIKHRALLALMRQIYGHADGVVAVSEGVAKDLARKLNLPDKSITTIYNPVVSQEMIDRGSDELRWDFHEPVIISVGRLTEAKDYPTLLKAFAHFRKQRKSTLVILGEGELREDLEALAKSLGVWQDVHMPGFVDNPYSWMKKADLFAMSSKWEGLPTVLIEALALGVPIVSTDCPSGPREILEQGRWGRLVPIGDDAAMAKAWVDVLNSARVPSTERAKDFSVELAATRYLAIALG